MIQRFVFFWLAAMAGIWLILEIRVTEARGIADSNNIISGSLTKEYLQHEVNKALLKFAEKGSASTVVLPANIPVTPLITTR